MEGFPDSSAFLALCRPPSRFLLAPPVPRGPVPECPTPGVCHSCGQGRERQGPPGRGWTGRECVCDNPTKDFLQSGGLGPHSERLEDHSPTPLQVLGHQFKKHKLADQTWALPPTCALTPLPQLQWHVLRVTTMRCTPP